MDGATLAVVPKVWPKGLSEVKFVCASTLSMAKAELGLLSSS